MVSRIDKINELIREQSSLVIYKYCADSFFAVSKVSTTPDLASCDIFVLTLGDDKKIIDFLNKKSKEIQYYISGKIQLRKMPRIKFLLDESEGDADRIESLLKQI